MQCITQSTNWELVNFLWAIYNLFRHVPARRADYTRLTGSNIFPLKFCTVRWLNNASVAERALQMLPCIKTYVKEAKKEKNEPKTACYRTLLAALEDPLLIAKLSFFQTLALEVEPFLLAFQADKPMSPFLYTELLGLMSRVMGRFIKEDVMKNSKSVKEIDILKKENLRAVKYVNIGHQTRASIRNVKELSEKSILLFKQDCLTALQTFCQKMKEKSPLAKKLTKNLTFCDPHVISESTHLAKSRLSSVIEEFVTKKWISGILGDKIENDFRSLCLKPGITEICKGYSMGERLDKFWVKTISDISGSDDLLAFLKMVLILSHGQADVERGFSVNKEFLMDNMSEKSLVSQRLIWSAIHAAGGVEKITITKTMINFVKNARSRYHEELKVMQKKESIAEQEKVRKRKAQELINNLKEKKKAILVEMLNLDEEIQSLVSVTR